MGGEAGSERGVAAAGGGGGAGGGRTRGEAVGGRASFVPGKATRSSSRRRRPALAAAVQAGPRCTGAGRPSQAARRARLIEHVLEDVLPFRWLAVQALLPAQHAGLDDVQRDLAQGRQQGRHAHAASRRVHEARVLAARARGGGRRVHAVGAPRILLRQLRHLGVLRGGRGAGQLGCGAPRAGLPQCASAWLPGGSPRTCSCAACSSTSEAVLSSCWSCGCAAGRAAAVARGTWLPMAKPPRPATRPAVLTCQLPALSSAAGSILLPHRRLPLLPTSLRALARPLVR